MSQLVRILTMGLYALAAVVAVGGMGVLVTEARSQGADPEWAALLGSFFAGALYRPLAWAGAVFWLLGVLGARWADYWASAPRRAGLPMPEVDERPARSVAENGAAGVARQRDVDRLRREALLPGSKPEPAAFVEQLVTMAVSAGASDNHQQPEGDSCRVTFRLRGALREAARYPAARHADIVRRLKVLAKLPPYVDREPQDGRLTVETPHGAAQIRLSTVPAREGERVALRLAGDAELRGLDALGLFEEDLESFRRLLAEPQGLVVLTGPTGSGKTTTLYSALDHIHETRGSTAALSSIEDPVEVDVPYLHQVPVDRARGITFVKALRSVLRQDPNVLMVGEIRDAETAKTAVQAGLSGHLILTTLHADSVASVFPRLIDLGVEPFLAASATLATVSQRLARRLCPECRHPRSLTADERRRLPEGFDASGADFSTAEGCRACERRGTAGRVAIFEILVVTPELRQLVASRAPIDQLIAAARAAGTVPLGDSALRLAAAGEISLEEAWRITG